MRTKQVLWTAVIAVAAIFAYDTYKKRTGG